MFPANNLVIHSAKLPINPRKRLSWDLSVHKTAKQINLSRILTQINNQ